VDAELAIQAGPQLVVPILNARYALNAANARWGSLYDALYGTDAISEEGGAEKGKGYNPVRGAKVIAFARNFLDQAAPLAAGSHRIHRLRRRRRQAGCHAEGRQQDRPEGRSQVCRLPGRCRSACIGAAEEQRPAHRHHRQEYPHRQTDAAGVADVVVEAALSTILDLEDSVAAVDAEDKVLGYSNWLGILKGTLTESFDKGGKTDPRPEPRPRIPAPTASAWLHGRSLMFVRNVGHLMTNPAILWGAEGKEIPEGIMDAVVTTAIAMHDLKGLANGIRNSRTGSVYIVKPKMHGPAEVGFANELFGRVEQLLGLPDNTVKLGIMDEERRTSVNLKACIAAAPARGLHQHRLPGPHRRRNAHRHARRPHGPQGRHEDQRLDPGLRAQQRAGRPELGLRGKAQIGKGMWAMPDLMKAMLEQKIAHPKAGANTAWVPRPPAPRCTPCTTTRSRWPTCRSSWKRPRRRRARQPAPPADRARGQQPQLERGKAAGAGQQRPGILGYVVRWVDQGVGCSKVPDIHNVGLMEDRATLRISSQHIANWLLHGVVTEARCATPLSAWPPRWISKQRGDRCTQRMHGRFDQSMRLPGCVRLVFGCGATQRLH
jgi:malate synthase